MRIKLNLNVVRSALILFLLVVSCVMTGCHDDTAHLKIIGDTFYYDPDNMFDYESYFAELEAQARPETEESIDITVPPDADGESEPDVTMLEANTVYWVKDGEVWHISAKCSSLARSKTILSGTVEAALESGKARVCKRCGD